MPELPEVETVRRGLSPHMEGQRITQCTVRRFDLRWPIPPSFQRDVLDQRVDHLSRRAKYILIHLNRGPVVLIHLGMSGAMTVQPVREHEPPGKHDHVIFDMSAADGAPGTKNSRIEPMRITFKDPRRFGSIDLVDPDRIAEHPRLASLGPEPLSNSFSPAHLAERLAGRAVSIKSALLDQKTVAGLGNIYVCEALFRAGISPLRAAGDLSLEMCDRLVISVRSVLQDAIEAGGSSLQDHRQASGEMGYFQHAFSVYDREGMPCPHCICDLDKTGGIQRIVQSGRSSFYCSHRQH